MKNILLLFLIVISMLSCSHKFSCCHKMNPENYKKSQIVFGSGGGFANLVNQYYLLENGRLYKKNKTDSNYLDLGKQKLDSVKILFAKTKVLFEHNKAFHEPGNTYYFIKFRHDATTNEIVWGASKENTPTEAKELYKELMNFVDLK